MERTWFALGAVLAALAVAAGAFGAHGLENRLSSDDLDTYQTAARYHMYHALALLAVGYAAQRFGGGLVSAAGWLFIAGILLFSGRRGGVGVALDLPRDLLAQLDDDPLRRALPDAGNGLEALRVPGGDRP